MLIGLISAIIAEFIILLLPQAQNQIHTFIANMSLYSKHMYDAVSTFNKHLNIEPTKLLPALISRLEYFGTLFLDTPSNIINTASTFLSLIMDIIIVPIVTYYLLVDWGKLSLGLLHLLPIPKRAPMASILHRSSYILRRFLHGELLVMLITGSVYFIGFEIANVPLGLPLGILVGLICVIPFASLLFVTLPALIFALLDVNLGMLSIVVATILMAKFLNNLVLMPILIGRYIHIHPAIVLLLVLSSGAIYGVIGMILALPIAAIITYEFFWNDSSPIFHNM